MKVFTSKTQKTGELGENEAVLYLKKLGFKIVERNTANKFGEIDIGAQRGKVYYFFEVKTGYKGGFVNPAENLTKEKLRKFLRSVEYYCLCQKVHDYRAQAIIVLFDQQRSVGCEILGLF